MKVRVSFLGATRNVTGSRFLVESNGTKILIDCGLYQERRFRSRNWDPFPVDPASIDAVCLTHAHLDHCGLLPKLVREGFSGRIYCTSATTEIARIVMLDSAHIQEEDAAYKKKRHAKEGRTPPHPDEPLYTTEDAQKVSPLFSPVKYKQVTQIADGVTAEFLDAGHILGASMVKLTLKNGNQQRILLFSGDLGRPGRVILRDPEPMDSADYVFLESTYGDRDHEPVEDIKKKFSRVINETRREGGNLVIPCFAIERSQEILYYLNQLYLEDLIPPLLTFLDSPMAISVTRVFEKYPELFDDEMTEFIRNGDSPFHYPALKMTRSTHESKAINSIRGTAIIMAGSGMCTGGRIKHHLVNNISDEDCTILFVGYQAADTLGRRLLEGHNPVRILGEERDINARIERIHGFSAHADRNEICEWLSKAKQPPKKIFLVHGEEEAALAFQDFLSKKLSWSVDVPEYNQTVEID